MTVADLALQDLATEHEACLERLRAYRELGCAALAELATLTQAYDRLRNAHGRTLAEYRRLLAVLMRQDEAA